MDVTQALTQYYGYATFKPGQKEIIETILAGENCVGILPTGSGKTLCYSLPTFLRGALTLVISPLIALMDDQAARLNAIEKNSALVLNSLANRDIQDQLLERLRSLSFLILSPEMLQNPRVLGALKNVRIQLVVIDEAHCLSQWGFDFRPEYLQILPTIKALRIPQILALTATCTPQVAKDIAAYLFTKKSYQKIQYPVNRANIGLLVEHCASEEERFNQLLDVLQKVDGAGIIYCNTRKKTAELSAQLNEAGISACFYHGGLTGFERNLLQQQFKNNRLQIMVATNAFGMGIDKENLRFVIHYELPGSLENYVQEIGRCGRDGLPGFALLFYVPGDEHIHYHFAKKRQETLSNLQNGSEQGEEQVTSKAEQFWTKRAALDKDKVVNLLTKKEDVHTLQRNAMLNYLTCEGCLREYIANYFADPKPAHPEKCCLNDGLTVQDYFSDKTISFSPEQKMTWQERLNLLFS